MIAKNRAEAARQAAIAERRKAIFEKYGTKTMKAVLNSVYSHASELFMQGGLERVNNFLVVDSIKVIQPALLDLYGRIVYTLKAEASADKKSLACGIETKATQQEIDAATRAILDGLVQYAYDSAGIIASTSNDYITNFVTRQLGSAEFVNAGPRAMARAMVEYGDGISLGQAERIARTETLSVYSEAQAKFTDEIWDEAEMGPLYKQWYSNRDRRVRDDHKKMNNRIVPNGEPFVMPNGDVMMYPGDRSSAKPENYVNCLLPDNQITFGNIVRLFRCQYVGEVVEIKTISGLQISVTMNHPILTSAGWMSAKFINKGCNIVKSGARNGLGIKDFNVNSSNTKVGELYNSLSKTRNHHRVSSSIVNFHGDRPDSNIEVIDVAWSLVDSIKAHSAQTRVGKLFELSKSIGVELVDDGSIDQFLASALLPSNSIMGLFGEFLDIISRTFSKSNLVSLASTSYIKAQLFNAPNDSRTTNSEDTSHLEDRNPVLMHLFYWFKEIRTLALDLSFDEVCSVTFSHYDGHVFNIEDINSFYTSAGIVNHNCRCSYAAIPEELVPVRQRKK